MGFHSAGLYSYDNDDTSRRLLRTGYCCLSSHNVSHRRGYEGYMASKTACDTCKQDALGMWTQAT